MRYAHDGVVIPENVVYMYLSISQNVTYHIETNTK